MYSISTEEEFFPPFLLFTEPQDGLAGKFSVFRLTLESVEAEEFPNFNDSKVIRLQHNAINTFTQADFVSF